MNRVRRGDVLQLDGFECHFWNREKGMMGSFMNVPSSVCLSVCRSVGARMIASLLHPSEV